MNDLTIRALRYYAGACMQKATDPGLFTGLQIDYQLEAERATFLAEELTSDAPRAGNLIHLEGRRGSHGS